MFTSPSHSLLLIYSMIKRIKNSYDHMYSYFPFFVYLSSAINLILSWRKQRPWGNSAALTFDCWKAADWIPGEGCKNCALWAGTGMFDWPCRASDKVPLPFLYIRTDPHNSSNKQIQVSSQTRSCRGPSTGFKIVDLFIVVKQWRIVLPQHKGSICSCWWKIENRSYFFPSSLSDNLQDKLARYYNLYHYNRTKGKTTISTENWKKGKKK